MVNSTQEKMMAGYVSKVVHRFKAGGEEWEVLDWCSGWIWIRETRCNGQEDCHMKAEFELGDKGWKVFNDDGVLRENISEYGSLTTLLAVIAFLDDNGYPPETTVQRISSALVG